MRFRTKLTGLFIITTLFVAIVISFLEYYYTQQVLEFQIKDKYEEQAFHIMDKIDRFLFERLATIEILATDPLISSNTSTPKQITERLRNYRNIYKSYVSLSFFNSYGIRIGDTSGMGLGEHYQGRQSFEDILQENVKTVVDICICEQLKLPVIYFTSLVKNKTGKVMGVVVARVPVSKLYTIIRNAAGIHKSDVKDVKIDLVNRDGLVIYSNYNRKRILKDRLSDWSAVKSSLTGELLGSKKHIFDGKEETIYVFSHEPGYLDFLGNDWTLIMNIPQESAFAQVDELRGKVIIIFLIVIVFSFVIVLFFSQSISRPIMELKDAAFSIGKGNLDTKAAIASKDEIGDLTRSFNEMVLNIKQKIADLKKVEEELERIFELSPDMVGTGTMDGYFTRINTSFKRLLGYEDEEFLTKQFIEFVHKEDIEKTIKELNEAREGKNIINITNRYKCKDGSFKWVEWNVLALVQENIFYAYGRDITERRQMEEALFEVSELNERIIKESPIGLAIYDQSGQCIAANKSIGEMVGATQEQVVAQNYKKIESWKKSGILDIANKSIRLQQKERHGFDVVTSFGKHAFYDCIFVPFKLRGEQHLLLMLDDISKRKQAEAELDRYRCQLEELVTERTSELHKAQDELLRKSRLATLGQLTATVSHELRNPLGAMRSSLYIIRKRMINEDLRLTEALERVDRNITRCDHIIDELLDFTRIRQLELQSTAVDDWLDDVLNELTVPKGITVIRKLSLPGLEVILDPNRLRRAVINIYDNACQAMVREKEDGNGEMQTLTVVTRKTGSRVELEFVDTGPGIPPYVLERIFEPLFSTKSFGVGLGLPTVQQIMDQHGGGIEIDTEPGRGTRMVLWLPIQCPKWLIARREKDKYAASHCPTGQNARPDRR